MGQTRVKSFRQWVQEIWYEHCIEHEEWLQRRPDYDIKDYFQKYKYWLKREYLHRIKDDK